MSVCLETERFAALLRSLKSRSGMSYEALARKSGLAGSTLHRYCRGTSVPQDYGSVHRLATVCGATPEELRTLHRLWALADAARTAAAGAEEEAAAAEARQEAPQEAEEAEDEAEEKAEPAGEGQAVPDIAGEPGPEPAPRPAGRSRRRRLRTSVVTAAILAALSVSAWALYSARTPSGNGGGGRGSGDDRPLFSANCPPVIAMGEHDECVKEVQRLLHAKGADIGIDGSFGPQTLRRVTAFQVLAGIQPNGVVEEPTKKALYASRVRMSVWSQEKVRQRVREVFPEVPDKAVAIADCQSFLDPLHILPNTNGTRNWGLFQISDARLRELGGTPRQALDPEWNIQAARRLWSRDRDFGDWPHCARAAEAPPLTATRPPR
ncbi:peptidoglycan-binding protein [Streptomyces violarus]|uniref:Transcriptional regulator with XRE-family HTH domain n=1 Tax=Streptomyces violarus TaxID=67380 RepID=A0A7W4ZQQ5_9ACTN|nr:MULTISPECIES: helix-turn-helix domain-containing protein [Streptomyces]MBB3076940.1 transcriptional regulator with XRE-family HTH domain [Streptomyces violarus]WRU01401.1 helix-turn-helix domain-containing protein [Streptomyces sp. CGMCC 4.1772]GHD22779.1 peptidoglycan-binding protein [Streptomyces violarus]